MPLGLKAFGLTLEVKLQLLVQVRLAIGALKEQRSDPAARDVPEAHDQVLCNTRLTPAESRSHFESFDGQLLAALAVVKRIEAGAAIVLGRPPLGDDPALVLEPV